MSDILKSGAAWLNTIRAAKMATNVTYRRGGVGSGIVMPGTVGRTEADQVIDATMISSAGIRDFIFSTTLFLIDGTFAEPKLGDTITEDDGAVWRVVEIGGEPAWRYSSAFKDSIRVHVVKVD